MKLEEVGSRFIVEPQGTSLSETERSQLQQLRPAAIMLRSRNFLGTKVSGVEADYGQMLDGLKLLLADMRGAIGRENILVTIDHEGGRVVRPPAPITSFPYPAYWGEAQEQVLEAFATELKSLGVNVIFGPVADIHSNPANPVIAERAFGRSVEEVIPRVLAYLSALQRHGLLTCAKHFPGHGDTGVDSHSELPVLDYSLEELRERELRPFKALIEAGIPMVMTAHVLLRKIDPENPATMSARILADLLRGELGFAGVVVADALAMKAILPQILTQRFAERVLEAQVDLLCVAGPGVDMGTAVGMAQNLCTALEANSDYQSLHQESQARVEALLARAGQYPVLELSQEVFAEHHALARRLSVNPAWSGAAKEYIPQGF